MHNHPLGETRKFWLIGSSKIIVVDKIGLVESVCASMSAAGHESNVVTENSVQITENAEAISPVVAIGGDNACEDNAGGEDVVPEIAEKVVVPETVPDVVKAAVGNQERVENASQVTSSTAGDLDSEPPGSALGTPARKTS